MALQRVPRRFQAVLAVLVVSLLWLSPPRTTPSTSSPVDWPFWGPVVIERDRGSPEVVSYSVDVPEWATGPFTLQVRNGLPDGKSRVTSAWVKINGTQVLRPSDFKHRKELIERQIELQTTNELDVEIHGKPGSRLEIVLMGRYVPPVFEETILAEQTGTLGSEGGILALPDIGEIELNANSNRQNIGFVLRNLQAPGVQDLFISEIVSDIPVTYTDTVFEIEADAELTEPIAIRLTVPAGFASSLPQDQQAELYALVETDDGSAFVALNAIYDPIDQIVVASLPVSAWQMRETSSAPQAVSAVSAAPIGKRFARISLASSPVKREMIAAGDFTSISGQGAIFQMAPGTQRMLTAKITILAPTIRKPFSDGINPPISQYYSDKHGALDYDVSAIEPLPDVVAAADGKISFDYQTVPIFRALPPGVAGPPCPCSILSNGNCAPFNGTNPDTGETLYGFGYYAKIEHTDSLGNTFYTIYAHLTPRPKSAQIPSGTVREGDPIATSGNSGCSTNPHLHFEYRFQSKATKLNPELYYHAADPAIFNQFMVGLFVNGVPAAAVPYQYGQTSYQLPLDLSQFNLQNGQRYPVWLALVDPQGRIFSLDWARVEVQAPTSEIAGFVSRDREEPWLTCDAPWPETYVELYLDNGDGAFDYETDSWVTETLTDDTGYYVFEDLQPGDYWIPRGDDTCSPLQIIHLQAGQQINHGICHCED